MDSLYIFLRNLLNFLYNSIVSEVCVSELFNLLIQDPIFQLSSVVFIAALSVGIWLIFFSHKKVAKTEANDKSRQAETPSSTVELSQDTKFYIVMENIKAINNRLDNIENMLKSGSGALHYENTRKLFEDMKNLKGLDEITKKLDAIYKILGNLGGEK